MKSLMGECINVGDHSYSRIARRVMTFTIRDSASLGLMNGKTHDLIYEEVFCNNNVMSIVKYEEHCIVYEIYSKLIIKDLMCNTEDNEDFILAVEELGKLLANMGVRYRCESVWRYEYYSKSLFKEVSLATLYSTAKEVSLTGADGYLLPIVDSIRFKEDVFSGLCDSVDCVEFDIPASIYFELTLVDLQELENSLIDICI